ncbi:hypothetical protein Q5Y75_10265 [Ruegeria sp. 2205SS24-7]|uniref:hypothetical protein n=1 Tax=Ruegeria discodermiae TaxID=3064389 RepID=UPI0027407A35|nr:hypothetical protein [Ruegeria sp. 2205SS24-7]MDP5217603.1 hypothetical protein [Ruegeria sp. 2205SS24-7]
MDKIVGSPIRKLIALTVILLIALIGYRLIFPDRSPPTIYVAFAEGTEFNDDAREELGVSLGLDRQSRRNLLLGQSEFMIVTRLQDLEPQLADMGGQKGELLVLFLLAPPIGESQKLLRQHMEHQGIGLPKGRERARVVPAIEPFTQDLAMSEICDAAIYARDVFNGLAILVRDPGQDVPGVYNQACGCLSD